LRRLEKTLLNRQMLRCDQSRRGIVLIIVTVVIVMAGLAGFSFVAFMSIEHKAAKINGLGMQADATVASGVAYLTALIDQPVNAYEGESNWYDNPDLFRSVPLTSSMDVPSPWRFSILSPRRDAEAITGLRFGLVNESSRLNLPALLEWERAEQGSAHRALMHLPNMTDAVADALLDWVDSDSRQRRQGAESNVYSSMPSPYDARNGAPESLEELLLVRDVTRGLLFGADVDRNYRVDAVEQRLASVEGSVVAQGQLPWCELLTVYSAERNVSSDGTRRINLNDRNLPDLYQRISSVLGEELATFVIAYRQYGPYSGKPRPEEDQDYRIDFSVRPRYTLKSVFDLMDVAVRIREPRSRVVLTSPLSSDDNELLRQNLPVLLDYASLTDAPILRGRINVNLAPPPVLMAVPGMTAEVVDRILTARQSGSSWQDGGRTNVAWLLTENIVDLETMKTIVPFLTTRGDVYRAQVVGFLAPDGVIKRAEVVIDGTRRPVRQVYWKDLGILGPGFPHEVLDATLEAEFSQDTDEPVF